MVCSVALECSPSSYTEVKTNCSDKLDNLNENSGKINIVEENTCELNDITRTNTTSQSLAKDIEQLPSYKIADLKKR